MQQAIDRMERNNTYPFVSVAATSSSTWRRSLTTTVHMDLEVSVKVGVGGSQAALSTYIGVAAGQSQSVSTAITNNDSWDKCYVLYQLAIEIHVWLYNNGACPY
jgi:hypothetical protein